MLNLGIYNLEINNEVVPQNEITDSVFYSICTIFIWVNNRCGQTPGVTLDSISAEMFQHYYKSVKQAHPIWDTLFSSRLKWFIVQLVIWNLPKVVQANIAEKVLYVFSMKYLHLLQCCAFVKPCMTTAVHRKQRSPHIKLHPPPHFSWEVGWAPIHITLVPIGSIGT